MSSVTTHFQGKPVSLDNQAILDAALSLPTDERLELAEQLMLSVDELHRAEVEAEQLAEVRRRIAHSDESKLIPFEQAMKMAKARQKP